MKRFLIAAVLVLASSAWGQEINSVLKPPIRDYIFQHQLEINPSNLRQFAERFATEHKTDLPFVYDPQGKFAAEVNSDRDMGNRIGIHQTPTIYVVSSKGQPYTEVSDLGSLFKTIDAVKNR
ncbi:MAG: hypothetical protein DMG91_03445 [Acidobacteria bacterium]|nr:MAG: hypothetical protein DMG91_03445 [Acidobacteriota bacterium]